MKTSERGVTALILHEGIVPGPYRDSVGVWTYGVGHTSAAGKPYPKNMKRGMPKNLDAEIDKVFSLFRADLAKYEARVNQAIKVPVEQHEFDAAVSFDYNTGAIHRATWVKSLNAGDRALAARQIMSWTKPSEIKERREAEQALFEKGTYPSGKVTVWGVAESGQVVWKPVRRIDVGGLGKASLITPTASSSNWVASLIQAILRMFK